MLQKRRGRACESMAAERSFSILPNRYPAAARVGGMRFVRKRLTSITVVVRLVRAPHIHADVLGLRLAELGQPDAELVQV